MSRQAVEVPTKPSSVTWIQPGEDCDQYNNTPLGKLTIKIPYSLSSWETTWIQPEEDCGQYNNTPLRQLTIKIPSSLSSWETVYKEFRSGDLLRFETPLVLPEGFEHQLPAGFQSTSTDMKVIDVCSENDCNMTIRVDNTCLWVCDEVRRDSDEFGFFVATPPKYMRNRVCPHCGINAYEKEMLKSGTISKWTAPWWRVCGVNLSQPLPKQPVRENRRQRRNRLLTQQRKTAPGVLWSPIRPEQLVTCWKVLWSENVGSLQGQPPLIVDVLC